MTVPEPRWLIYRLLDVSDPALTSTLVSWVHPALAGGPVPSVLDSSWLASGEGLRESHAGVYGLVQAMFDRGAPPVVQVVSDHGTWGSEAEALGAGLVDEVEWDAGPAAVPSFRGRPGFVYSGETLDLCVFARPGALPGDADAFVAQMSRLPGDGSVEDLLRAEPEEALSRLKPGLGSDASAAMRYHDDAWPAYLVVVAARRLAQGMVPVGMVLGVWDVKGSGAPVDGEPADLTQVDSPRVRALRRSLVGTVLPTTEGTNRGWRRTTHLADGRT